MTNERFKEICKERKALNKNVEEVITRFNNLVAVLNTYPDKFRELKTEYQTAFMTGQPDAIQAVLKKLRDTNEERASLQADYHKIADEIERIRAARCELARELSPDVTSLEAEVEIKTKYLKTITGIEDSLRLSGDLVYMLREYSRLKSGLTSKFITEAELVK